MAIKLDGWERNNMISTLEWRTGFRYEYLKSLKDEQLSRLLKEKVG